MFPLKKELKKKRKVEKKFQTKKGGFLFGKKKCILIF